MGNMLLFVVSNEKRTLPYSFSPVRYAVPLLTRVTKGTEPSPRALSAGSERLPPSIRFHTTCSTLKLRTGVLPKDLYPLTLGSQ